MTIVQHIVVPVATEEDAAATCTAIKPYLDEIERVTAVHVIEKAGGAPDKAPLEKRQEDAADILASVDTALSDRVDVDTQTAYGTDIVVTLFEEAANVGGTAIAFRSRGGGRIERLLGGDVSTKLVTDPELPVISLPGVE